MEIVFSEGIPVIKRGEQYLLFSNMVWIFCGSDELHFNKTVN